MSSLKNRVFYFYYITFFLIFASLAYPQENTSWEFAGWQGGGCFPNIELDLSVKGRVYLTSDVAGIWRSDDQGEHWRFVTKGLKNLNVAALAISVSDSNVLYAATAGGIYVSLDAGQSWSAANHLNKQIKFERPQSYRPIAISPKNPLNVCVATAKAGVFCSVDGAEHWQALGQGQQEVLTAILFDQEGKNIFVGGLLGLQTYDFSTAQWSALNSQLKDLTDLSVVKEDALRLYAAAGGDLWISDDAGVSWQKSSGNHDGKIFRLALVGKKIFAAVNKDWNGKILISDDEGATWKNPVTKITPDTQANPTRAWANLNGRIASLKADPFDSQVIFRSDWWGVFRSDDGGKTWTEKIHGAPNSVGSDISVTKNSLLVATMDNGLLKSSDGGKSYQPIFPSTGYDPAKAGHVWRVIVPSENRIVATSSPWNEKVNQVIVSDDGGLNFKIVRQGLPQNRPTKNTMWGQGYPRGLAFDPKDPNKIYLGVDGDDGGGLFVSQDGGYRWARSVGQPGSLRIYNALAVDPTDSNRIFWGACGKAGGVYVSSDAGQTWHQTLKAMTWVFDLMVTPSGVVYAAGDMGGTAVFVSSDHGETWKKLKNLVASGAAEALAFNPTDEKTIAVSSVLWGAGAPGKIYLSRDAGASWSDVSANLPDGAGMAAMAFSPDGKYLYALRYAGSVYRLKLKE